MLESMCNLPLWSKMALNIFGVSTLLTYLLVQIFLSKCFYYVIIANCKYFRSRETLDPIIQYNLEFLASQRPGLIIIIGQISLELLKGRPAYWANFALRKTMHHHGLPYFLKEKV
ncbi:hypothetical protein FGO68_gene12334 [Halteria grandinella]|uniref:Uncharacterized protein n=1 Tax=Halteria grandinella TaxID=5974 RepID=A0A8J8T4R2_HALGN|nr:hypothetical protein FGO68_gene12334 [Halteria grandinella]